jgi:hypothetical protein
MFDRAIASAISLCGVGFCLIGAGLVLQSGVAAQARAEPTAAGLVSAFAAAQAGPTVVWYGVSSPSNYFAVTQPILFRAWSDGTVEAKVVSYSPNSLVCPPSNPIGCTSDWVVIASPTQGFKAASDINADQKVDGADLAMILGNWGDAPRVPIPPSDCPLNLINP